jgi:hypothetical protein
VQLDEAVERGQRSGAVAAAVLRIGLIARS